MKLSLDAMVKLDQLVSTSLIGGIKKLIIEGDGTTANTKIRGIDEKQTVVIITDQNVPDLGGKNLGINRLEQLSARLSLVKSQGDLEINATEASNGTDFQLLDLKGGKTSAQFRSASPESVKGVPKQIADKLVWQVTVDSKIIPTLTQATTAMGAEVITIASRDGTTVSFECVDSNKDVFTTEASVAPQWIGGGTAGTSFCQKYPAKIFIALMKEIIKNAPSAEIKIGEGGIMSMKVNGFDFYVIPAQ